MRAGETAPESTVGPGPGRGRSLLLVEDSPLQRRLLEDHLRSVGFEVRSVPTAADAFVRLGEGRPDAVVCDVVLPGVDGFSLCRAVTADPALGGVPVVLVTSTDVDESDRLLARRAGAAALVGRRPGYDAVVEALVAALESARSAGSGPVGGPLGDLRERFLEEGRDRAAALLESVGADPDWPGVARAAHRWIGRGGALGFPAIADLARGLDTAASNADREGARASLTALARTFEGAAAARGAGFRPAAAAAPAVDPGPEPGPRPGPVRGRDVVLADDDPTVVAIVRATLENDGWRCHVAENGVEALALARRVRPAAVIVDVNMPGRDGFEVLAELRGRRDTRDVPVLLLTARHQEIDVLRGFDLGAADYVVKPFNPLELAARLKRLAPGGA